MFGSSTFYNLFEIDASDIWSYERARFYDGDQNDNSKQFIESIYSSIQVFFIKAKCEPAIKYSDLKSGETDDEYYKNNFNRVSNIKEGIAGDMFIARNNIYSLLTACIVRKNEFNSHDFEKLFALKLRQYHDGLSFLDDFLNFQLGRNFEGNVSDFKRFLNNVLEQYDNLIDKKINAKVITWTEEATKIEFNSQIKDTPDSNQINDLSSPSEQAESGSAISDKIPSNLEKNSIQTETLIPIPSDYKIVKGKFSLEDFVSVILFSIF